MSLTEEQREERRKSIGSSDVAAVVGLSPYATQHDVWLAKCGYADFGGNEATEIGDLLEPCVGELYARRKAVTVRKNDRAFVCNDNPIFTATPDFFSSEGRMVEAKVVGVRSAFSWGSEREIGENAIPTHYLAQVQWQMYVCFEQVIDVAALIGTEFRVWSVKRDDKLCEAMAKRAYHFWFTYVRPRVPPPIDGSESCAAMLKAIYPRSNEAPRPASERQEQLASQLRAARFAAIAAESEQRLIESELKASMGAAERIDGSDFKVRWRTSKNGQRPFVFTDALRDESRKDRAAE